MAAAPECSNIQAWRSLMVTQRCEVWQNASRYNCFYTNFHIAAAADVLATVIPLTNISLVPHAMLTQATSSKLQVYPGHNQEPHCQRDVQHPATMEQRLQEKEKPKSSHHTRTRLHTHVYIRLDRDYCACCFQQAMPAVHHVGNWYTN